VRLPGLGVDELVVELEGEAALAGVRCRCIPRPGERSWPAPSISPGARERASRSRATPAGSAGASFTANSPTTIGVTIAPGETAGGDGV
jgi:hypothetical protein